VFHARDAIHRDPGLVHQEDIREAEDVLDQVGVASWPIGNVGF